MSVLVLTNAAIYAAQADLTGRSNKVELTEEAEELDTTVFGTSGWKSMTTGLRSAKADIEGYFEALDATYPDERLFTDLGVSTVPFTFSPTGGAVGDVAWIMSSLRSTYTVGGSVGDVVAYQSSASGDGARPLVRGNVLNSAATALTATGSGSQVLVGAASSTQKLYAALHVLSISGTAVPTLTMRVQSDTTGFPSATTQITFTAATAVGSQYATPVSGPITDTYYRADYTISGTNPSFLAVLAVGIA